MTEDTKGKTLDLHLCLKMFRNQITTMKFNSKNHPILSHLNSGESLYSFQEGGLTKIYESLTDFPMDWEEGCRHMINDGEIDYVSVPFFEKIRGDVLFKKLVKLFSSISDCSGVILYPPQRFSKIHAVSYVIGTDNEGNLVMELHLYSMYGRILVLYVEVTDDKIDWSSIVSPSVSPRTNENPFTQEQLDNWYINHIQTVLAILTFKEFAEIEVNQIGGKVSPKKLKIGKEKYLNESPNPINVLDSNWFTEIVRSKGFSVQGHFRFQACGEGLRDRKLIYVSDFEKTGYNRKAKIQIKDEKQY